MPTSFARLRDDVARTARLAAPLAAGRLSHQLVGFIDTVVAGHHGTATLASGFIPAMPPAPLMLS